MEVTKDHEGLYQPGMYSGEERRKANVTVSNPSHYAGDDNLIEPIDRIANLPFNFGSANKYIKRLGLKGGDNTEARDAGSTTWYATDLMYRFLAEEDGEYVPTSEDFDEFDVNSFITRVGAFAEAVESELRLSYSDDMHKRFVLAAQDMLIQQVNNAIKVGMSDRQYRDFVLEALFVSYYTIRFAAKFSPTAVYRGAKSFPLTDELTNTFAYVMGRIEAKSPMTKASTLQWGFGATQDHL